MHLIQIGSDTVELFLIKQTIVYLNNPCCLSSMASRHPPSHCDFIESTWYGQCSLERQDIPAW